MSTYIFNICPKHTVHPCKNKMLSWRYLEAQKSDRNEHCSFKNTKLLNITLHSVPPHQIFHISTPPPPPPCCRLKKSHIFNTDICKELLNTLTLARWYLCFCLCIWVENKHLKKVYPMVQVYQKDFQINHNFQFWVLTLSLN